MKYLVVLLLGIVAGGVLTLGVLFYNPFSSQTALSPLSVSENEQLVLNYSAVADNAIVFTNNGDSITQPHPDKVLQLWEAPIRQTDALVAVLRDSRNAPAGIGVKFSSRSERTRLLGGDALVDSTWYIYLPGRGSLVVEQSENYWSFLREIVIPAHWNSGDKWRGNWFGTISDGPGALGTGEVFGGSGEYAGLHSDAIETLTATAYSTQQGPLALDGRLTIELVGADAEEDF